MRFKEKMSALISAVGFDPKQLKMSTSISDFWRLHMISMLGTGDCESFKINPPDRGSVPAQIFDEFVRSPECWCETCGQHLDPHSKILQRKIQNRKVSDRITISTDTYQDTYYTLTILVDDERAYELTRSIESVAPYRPEPIIDQPAFNTLVELLEPMSVCDVMNEVDQEIQKFNKVTHVDGPLRGLDTPTSRHPF